MTNLPHVAPFADDNPEPPPKKLDMRGLLSLVTMLVSLAALSASMIGASRMIFDVFTDGLENITLEEVLTKTVVLGLAFLFGWVCGLVSIRSFGNLVYPLVIRIYAWGCLIAVSLLYLFIIRKLFLQGYEPLHFWVYLITLLGGLFVLICLHLLMDGHDLRPFSIPLLVVSVVHLFEIVMRYVYIPNTENMKLVYDLTIFFAMILISALMLAHIGILEPLRKSINGLFENVDHSRNENKKA